jgi:hypothetical protein
MLRRRAEAFTTFVRYFIRYVLHVREILVSLLLLILAGGLTVSWVEGESLGRSIYFACITGLTIGYGDITPKTGWGMTVSVAIGFIGMIFTGITIAVATRALADLGKHHPEHDK